MMSADLIAFPNMILVLDLSNLLMISKQGYNVRVKSTPGNPLLFTRNTLPSQGD